MTGNTWQAGPDVEFADAYDVIVVGAGAAGLAAASCASRAGLSVLLVEKRSRIGGTSAISGGMVWAPANRLAAQAGLTDSVEAAMRYLAATVDDGAADPALRAFVERAGEAIDHLVGGVGIELQPVAAYPDYYQAANGASLGGRVLEAKPFDIRNLGRHMTLLAPPLPELTLFGGMMVSRADLPAFRKPHKSLAALAKVARLSARFLCDRLTLGRAGTLVLGNALVARLFKACLDGGATIATQTTLSRLVAAGRRIEAVELTRGPKTVTISARRGVILAGGGFSHDPVLRQRLLPAEITSLSAAEVGGAGETIAAAVAVGARLRPMTRDNALWVPLSTFRRPDGSAGRFPHTVTDRGKPGLIAVTREGHRFVNEAMNYHHFCQALLQATPAGREARAFLICDARFLRRYGLGAVRPFGIGKRRMIACGYLCEAPSVEALALCLRIPAEILAETVLRYNEGARLGEDRAYGRGSDAYQRHFGDPDHRPNPCVAPIEHGPFYAITVRPAALGTAAGLDVDTQGRVVASNSVSFENLYACGNDMRSVMNGSYPGPGITLGPALVFAYIAVTCLMSDRLAAG